MYIHTHTTIQDYTKAEQLYKRALACDSTHHATLCNYATLLAGVKKEYERAEAMLTQAPFHPTALQVCMYVCMYVWCIVE